MYINICRCVRAIICIVNVYIYVHVCTMCRYIIYICIYIYVHIYMYILLSKGHLTVRQEMVVAEKF
jgi:hypothetical protein